MRPLFRQPIQNKVTKIALATSRSLLSLFTCKPEDAMNIQGNLFGSRALLSHFHSFQMHQIYFLHLQRKQHQESSSEFSDRCLHWRHKGTNKVLSLTFCQSLPPSTCLLCFNRGAHLCHSTLKSCAQHSPTPQLALGFWLSAWIQPSPAEHELGFCIYLQPSLTWQRVSILPVVQYHIESFSISYFL